MENEPVTIYPFNTKQGVYVHVGDRMIVILLSQIERALALKTEAEKASGIKIHGGMIVKGE